MDGDSEPQSNAERLDEARFACAHCKVRLRASRAQAERLLVSCAYTQAADEAACVLSAELARCGGGGEDLREAAAAVLLQGRRLAGAQPQALRSALEAAFGALRGVPPETLQLWYGRRQRLPLPLSHAPQGAPRARRRRQRVRPRHARRRACLWCASGGAWAPGSGSLWSSLSVCLCAPPSSEPGERLAHPPEALAQLARTLVLDAWRGQPAAALAWLAAGATAVTTQETRAQLRRQVEQAQRAQEEQSALAAKQWAEASEVAARRMAMPTPRPAPAPQPVTAPRQPHPAAPALAAVEKRAGVGGMLGFVRRGRSAARADPEGAACVALLTGCAVYALSADKRGLRSAVGAAGAALSSMASLALGYGPPPV